MKINKLYFFSKDIIFFLFAILISLSIFFSNKSTYVQKVEAKIIDLIAFIYYPKNWYNDILLVKSKNELLNQKVTQLKLLNAKLQNYKNENDKLKKMLNFKESYSRLSLKPANKVNHNYSSIFSIIINVGSNDEINKNQAVLDMNGLVGKTISIGKNGSKVQLITDKNYAVSVKIGKDMFISTFKPLHGRIGYLEGVIKSLKLEKGEIIYTSGVSEIYPSDIPVGKIISFKKNPDKLYQDVIVEVLADIENLNYVFVIQ